jgi:hypothetical protein
MHRLQQHPTRSLGLVRSRKVHLYISKRISILSNTTRLSMPLKLVRSNPFYLKFYMSFFFQQRHYGHTLASDTCSCFLLLNINLLNIQLIWLLLCRLPCLPLMMKIQQPRRQRPVVMFMRILLMVIQHKSVTKLYVFIFDPRPLIPFIFYFYST